MERAVDCVWKVDVKGAGRCRCRMDYFFSERDAVDWRMERGKMAARGSGYDISFW